MKSIDSLFVCQLSILSLALLAIAASPVRAEPRIGTRYLSQDHLGSTVAVSDRNGEPVAVLRYQSNGSPAIAGGADALRWARFTGKAYDASTGLYDFGARTLDPASGRFLSSDPAGQTMSPYLYAGAAPLQYVDPDGRVFIPKKWKADKMSWAAKVLGIDLTFATSEEELRVARTVNGYLLAARGNLARATRAYEDAQRLASKAGYRLYGEQLGDMHVRAKLRKRVVRAQKKMNALAPTNDPNRPGWGSLPGEGYKASVRKYEQLSSTLAVFEKYVDEVTIDMNERILGRVKAGRDQARSRLQRVATKDEQYRKFGLYEWANSEVRRLEARLANERAAQQRLGSRYQPLDSYRLDSSWNSDESDHVLLPIVSTDRRDHMPLP